MARTVDDLVLRQWNGTGRRGPGRREGHYIYDLETDFNVGGPFYSHAIAVQRLAQERTVFEARCSMLPDDAPTRDNPHLRPSVRPEHVMPEDGSLLMPDGMLNMSDLVVGMDFARIEERIVEHMAMPLPNPLANPCGEIHLDVMDTMTHPRTGRVTGRRINVESSSITQRMMDAMVPLADTVVAPTGRQLVDQLRHQSETTPVLPLPHPTEPAEEIFRTEVRPLRNRSDMNLPGGRALRYSMGVGTFMDQINNAAHLGRPLAERVHGLREGDQIEINGQTYRVTGNIHDSVSIEPVPEKEEPLTLQEPTGVRALCVYTDDEAGLKQQVTDLEARVAELTGGWASMIMSIMSGRLGKRKSRKHDRIITFKMQPTALKVARAILERATGDEVHKRAEGDNAGGHPDQRRRDVRIS